MRLKRIGERKKKKQERSNRLTKRIDCTTQRATNKHTSSHCVLSQSIRESKTHSRHAMANFIWCLDLYCATLDSTMCCYRNVVRQANALVVQAPQFNVYYPKIITRSFHSTWARESWHRQFNNVTTSAVQC